jgi:serine protease Do
MVGSGVLIDERGYIVTNRHVVGSARDIKVRLHDGAELAANVVFGEAACDLAVLKIDTARKLPALKLAPASDLMVGETVIAVGHPFGYSNTVSSGIISALDREIAMPSGETLTGLIQMTASINPGNSGGPLLNINGELIGINVALRDGAQGIAFAINAGTVEQVLTKHLSALKIAGVRHGLACSEKLLGETGERQRVVVAQVSSTAGDLSRGDEILAVGARPVANAFDLERALWDKKPGEKVDVRIVRQGRELTVVLNLGPAGGTSTATASSPASHDPTHPNTSGVPVVNRP